VVYVIPVIIIIEPEPEERGVAGQV